MRSTPQRVFEDSSPERWHAPGRTPSSSATASRVRCVSATRPRLSLSLTHERLFLPLSAPLDPPETARILPELRELLFSGCYQAAADRVCEFAAQQNPGFEGTRWIDPLIGAATVSFESTRTRPPGSRRGSARRPAGGAAGDGNERGVDFAAGVATVSGTDAAGWLRHRAFTSRPDNVVVLQTRADTGTVEGILGLAPIDGTPPARIDISASVAGPDPIDPSQATLRLTATFPDRLGRCDLWIPRHLRGGRRRWHRLGRSGIVHGPGRREHRRRPPGDRPGPGRDRRAGRCGAGHR